MNQLAKHMLVYYLSFLFCVLLICFLFYFLLRGFCCLRLSFSLHLSLFISLPISNSLLCCLFLNQVRRLLLFDVKLFCVSILIVHSFQIIRHTLSLVVFLYLCLSSIPSLSLHNSLYIYQSFLISSLNLSLSPCLYKNASRYISLFFISQSLQFPLYLS